MTDAAGIARWLRGRSCTDGFLCRCPVPSHGKGRGDRTPSLLISNGDTAVLFKCFAGCDPQDILAELRRRGVVDGPRDDRYRDRVPTDAAPEHKPNPEALELWRNAGSISGTAVAKFLGARGLVIDAPPSLRATMVLHLGRYPLPAMIAAVQAPDRRIIAVQKTLIDPRGDRKAQVHIPRMTIGALGWGAIRLGAATTTLGLAEGTEKGLAAMQLFGVPCWSSLGAARMHRVWVPDQVSELHVFLDNDEAGRTAAVRTTSAHRYRRVILRFPPEQFKDWDEVTQANARCAA
jgi:putative DNA primase/helicase